MLPRWMMVVFWMLTEAWSPRRDARIRFLQAQGELLRQRLPGNRVILTPEERNHLLRCCGWAARWAMRFIIYWASSVSRRTSGG